ncbi:AzlC family ABC transporter permease [Shewanella inventionis]|uniref:Branched-chain amino acid efflux pump permease component 1 AzlC family protein n=1 Tax=Shewanella inventionis TaxID=1738770 RepID=A0ABQ1IYS1_9GAMM|nr:branched-chain amino acid efflux pump permease component 1 AzlC family protein [Shewanella inventionis]
MSTAESITRSTNKTKSFFAGALAVMPLTIAVIPWGILAGSFALEIGLTAIESQAMSAIIFAGSAQLVALGMIKTGIGIGSILITTLLITSRHLLYAMAMRSHISPLPLKWRLGLGFLLTDELFAISNQTHGGQTSAQHQFDRWYALGGGLTFYIGWNIATLLGIVAGQSIDNLGELGLDFAIAATFIAIVVPTVKKPSILVSVLVSLTLAVVCAVFAIQAGLLIAAISGMAAGMAYAKFTNEGIATTDTPGADITPTKEDNL